VLQPIFVKRINEGLTSIITLKAPARELPEGIRTNAARKMGQGRLKKDHDEKKIIQR
jgi:hypothetical protein